MKLFLTCLLVLIPALTPIFVSAQSSKGAPNAEKLVAGDKPMPVPMPQPIQAPRDVPFPGTIQLKVDATDVLRRIYQIQETIPIEKTGPITLLFPQWTPGDHGPNGPLEKLAGLVMTADGKRLHWVRDTVNVYAFHVHVPAGVGSLSCQYQYLGSLDQSTGPVLISPNMIDLQWQSVVLYPAGYFARDILYQPSVMLPSGWTFLSSLDGGKSTGDLVTFPPVTLDTLVDSPVMAGRYLKQVVLTEDPVPVWLDVAAEDPSGLAGVPEAAKGLAKLTPEAYKLFASHHYDHYDHMLFLSDDLGGMYFEHHRSGENWRPADFLKSAENPPSLSFIAHGYVHAWNGMFRRPAEMWTPNFNTPERDSMFWIFEGLTEYFADVLSARAGMLSHEEALEKFTDLAAAMAADDIGADWRNLQDTNNEPLIAFRMPLSWASWQRNMFDPYSQGEMIWLEVDTIIRQRSGGKKTLDDFASIFFGGDNGSYGTKTYTFNDMVAALNTVQPYDWHGFLRAHLDSYGQGQSAGAIERSGYKLVFTDRPLGDGSPGKALNLTYSVGMRVNAAGRITAVRWDGPAFKAKLTSGETITSVNGKPYDADVLTNAIHQAVNGGSLELVVNRGAWQQTTSIEWRGGLRNPHIERIEGVPDLLDDILAKKR